MHLKQTKTEEMPNLKKSQADAGDGRKKLVNKSLKLAKKLKTWEDRWQPGNVPVHQKRNARNDGDLDEPVAGGFAAHYFSRDPYDDIIEVKGALASDRRPAPITDKEVAAVLRKRHQAEEFKLDNFFFKHYGKILNPSNPAELRWGQQVMPHIWTDRLKLIEEQAEIQKRIAKMKLIGPQSKEDITFLHGIEMGYVPVVRQPLWDLTKEPADDGLKRGWWNPQSKDVARRQGQTGAHNLSDMETLATKSDVRFLRGIPGTGATDGADEMATDARYPYNPL